jgi:RNA polymerase sigma factor (sigma-70 family)
MHNHHIARALAHERAADLLRAATDGQPGAWDRLVARFTPLIASIARRHRLAEHDAADVAQATWLRLLDNVDRLVEPEAVGGWLATTARRESLRVIRSRARAAMLGGGLLEAPSAEPSMDDRLQEAERSRALRSCLSRLRESDRALLGLLVAESEPSYEEISKTLEMPVGSIGPTRARALGRLRTELEREQVVDAISW